MSEIESIADEISDVKNGIFHYQRVYSFAISLLGIGYVYGMLHGSGLMKDDLIRLPFVEGEIAGLTNFIYFMHFMSFSICIWVLFLQAHLIFVIKKNGFRYRSTISYLHGVTLMPWWIKTLCVFVILMLSAQPIEHDYRLKNHVDLGVSLFFLVTVLIINAPMILTVWIKSCLWDKE